MHFRCTSCAKVNREQVSLEKSIMFIMCIQCTTLHSKSILVTPVTNVPVNLLLFNAMSLSHYLHNITAWIQLPVRVHYLHWSCTSIRLNHIWKMQSFFAALFRFLAKIAHLYHMQYSMSCNVSSMCSKPVHSSTYYSCSLLRKPLIHKALKNEDAPPMYTEGAFNYKKMYSYDYVLQSCD